MTLHDPPGGSSVSSFTNTRVATTFSHQEATVNTGWDYDSGFFAGINGEWGTANTVNIGVMAFNTELSTPAFHSEVAYQQEYHEAEGYTRGNLGKTMYDGAVPDVITKKLALVPKVAMNKYQKLHNAQGKALHDPDGKDKVTLTPSAISSRDETETVEITYATSGDPDLAGPMADTLLARVDTPITTHNGAHICKKHD